MGHDPYADERDEQKSRETRQKRERRTAVVRLSTKIAEANVELDQLKQRKIELEKQLDKAMDK